MSHYDYSPHDREGQWTAAYEITVGRVSVTGDGTSSHALGADLAGAGVCRRSPELTRCDGVFCQV